MPDPETLRQAILERLSSVIDPETGVDVVRMRLIEDLTVDEKEKNDRSPLICIVKSLTCYKLIFFQRYNF